MVYVPLGYSHSSIGDYSSNEIHGGSPWGASMMTGSMGERQPQPVELELAQHQGKVGQESIIWADAVVLRRARRDLCARQDCVSRGRRSFVPNASVFSWDRADSQAGKGEGEWCFGFSAQSSRSGPSDRNSADEW